MQPPLSTLKELLSVPGCTVELFKDGGYKIASQSDRWLGMKEATEHANKGPYHLKRAYFEKRLKASFDGRCFSFLRSELDKYMYSLQEPLKDLMITNEGGKE